VFLGVGWFLLQQTRDGLLDQRRQAVVAEANEETRSARSALQSVWHGPRRRQPAHPAGQPDPRGAAFGFSVALVRPGSSVDPDGPRGVVISSPGLDLSSIDRPAAALPGVDHHGMDLYPDPGRRDRRIRPRHRGRVGDPAARGRVDVHAYYLFPLADEQETLGLVTGPWPPPPGCW
jgi:two-component system sensor histidine kinase MtrB